MGGTEENILVEGRQLTRFLCLTNVSQERKTDRTVERHVNPHRPRPLFQMPWNEAER
jgi:hypothetical protein